MVEGTAEFPLSSVDYQHTEEGRHGTDEQFSGVVREPDLEKVKANALARERVLKIRARLDEIRAERSAQLVTKDTDIVTGKVRNGLFAWRAIKRSVEQTFIDLAKSASDLRQAEEDVEAAGVSNEHIEGLIAGAAEGFNTLSSDQAKSEMNQLLGVIAERYQLDQEARQVHPVISKLRSIIESNSPAINIVIGSVFRIVFKGVTHTAGLGGAVLASATYGAASKGVGEYRAARSELLGARGWREALSGLESPKQKLEIMRQMIVDKDTLKKYFAGNSSEAFEFFGQYQDLLAQCEEIDSEKILNVRVSSVEDVYSQRRREISSRAWRAAGRGAARAAVFSGIGYIGTHLFSELMHGDIAHGDQTNANATAQSQSRLVIPTALHSPEEGGNHDIAWRYHQDIPEYHARLEINPKTGFFRDADGQESLVKIEGDGSVSDTGSTPQQVANIIAKYVAGSYKQEHSLPIDSDQQQRIQEHIAKWLEDNKGGDLENGEFKIDETVHVPASELNAAMQHAGVTGESIKHALGLDEASGAPGVAAENGGFLPGTTDKEIFPPSDGSGPAVPPGDGVPPSAPGGDTQPYPPGLPQSGGPEYRSSPGGELLQVPGSGAKVAGTPAAEGPEPAVGAEAEADLDHKRKVLNIVAGSISGALLIFIIKKVRDKWLSRDSARGQASAPRSDQESPPDTPERQGDDTGGDENKFEEDAQENRKVAELRPLYHSHLAQFERDPSNEEVAESLLSAANSLVEELKRSQLFAVPPLGPLVLGESISVDQDVKEKGEEILRICDEILELNLDLPESLAINGARAAAYMCGEPDYARVVKYLDQLPERNNISNENWTWTPLYAFALLKQGDYKKAFELAKKKTESENVTGLACMIAAEASLGLGEQGGIARDYYNKARELDRYADLLTVEAMLSSGNFSKLQEAVSTAREPKDDAKSDADSKKIEPNQRDWQVDAFRECLSPRLQPAFDAVMEGRFPSINDAKNLRKTLIQLRAKPLWFVEKLGSVADSVQKDEKNIFVARSVASDCYWILFSSPGDIEREEHTFAAQKCLEHSKFSIIYAKEEKERGEYRQRIDACEKYLDKTTKETS